ncbi:hypothetical protein K3495_g1395 [Podosphaera aphanis]|nr:hypothetical protein K3495_g1395 [Podosphaera aphanis]
MNSRYNKTILESDEYGGFGNYRQLFQAEALRYNQNLGDNPFPDAMYELTIDIPTPKASIVDDSSRSPASQCMRKSMFKLEKRPFTGATVSPPYGYRKKLKLGGMPPRCSNHSCSEPTLLAPKCCLNETICNDSGCEIPPCNEPGCDLNDVFVCVDENNCDASAAACKKDCLSLQTTRPKSPLGEWSSSEKINTENFMSGHSFATSLATYLKSSTSPTPATPLLSNHPSTIYSQTDFPTPKGPFSPLDPHKDRSDLFQNMEGNFPPDSSTCNVLEQQWYNNRNLSQSADESFAFKCPWRGCTRLIEDGDQWDQHIHEEHIDPQMVYICPVQADTCPENITNPMAHLQNYHDFDFNANGDGYRCPGGNCQQGVELFDPSSFHNHLDHFHATPGSGQVQCQLWACGHWFDDPNKLISHAKQNHTIPVWSKPAQEHSVSSGPAELPPSTENQSQFNESSKDDRGPINPRKPKETLAPRPQLRSNDNNCLSSTTDPIKKGRLESEKSAVHQCQWGNPQDIVCGIEFSSENDLHFHIKETHLECLDNKSGYYCRWIGCTRESRLGSKSGFSQRGKLERHMATHTNFKCSTCDICGSSFSAPQAMRQHRRLHTGERPWECKHCGKTFTQQSACTVHERTHTNEKPLECPICFKKFSESSNLTKHRKTHGEKGAHACTFPDCDKTFHRYDQLKRHLHAHFKNKKLADSSRG